MATLICEWGSFESLTVRDELIVNSIVSRSTLKTFHCKLQSIYVKPQIEIFHDT